MTMYALRTRASGEYAMRQNIAPMWDNLLFEMLLLSRGKSEFDSMSRLQVPGESGGVSRYRFSGSRCLADVNSDPVSNLLKDRKKFQKTSKIVRAIKSEWTPNILKKFLGALGSKDDAEESKEE